ncbi:MAG: FAD-dependent oxidoreductase [Lachnospiraceae bacterium]|nr:FAD-dependent oxidoreductase [Lachnospiraceae bacterium]
MKPKTRIILSLSAALCLSSFGMTAFAEGVYTPGTYSAEAMGMHGPVSVTVTVDESEITEAVLDVSGESADYGQKAGDELTAQIMEAQSAEIDGVAGATMTSGAVKEALQACLDEASGTEKAEAEVKMEPGTYKSEAYGFHIGWSDKIEVTVSETGIEEIAYGEDCGDTPPMLDVVGEQLFPRIIENQSVAVDGVTGATATSGAVKSAVEDCLKQALAAGGTDESAISAFKTIPEKAGGEETIETDILVVGLGGSGTYTALRAAENGGKVLAIEQEGRYGGTTALTSEIESINPPRIKEKYNNGEDYCDAEAMHAAWEEYVEGDQKPELLDLFFNESGNALDWLALDHGIMFDFEAKVGFTPSDVYPVKFQWYPNTSDWAPVMFGANKAEIAANFDHLMEEYVELGGEYMLETKAYELITDDNGAVIGVKAKNNLDGTEYTIYAKAVVLACGGFIGSGEMTERYLSDEYFPLKGSWKVYGSLGNDGTMLRNAIDNGAATYNIGMPPEVHMSGASEFILPDAGYEINILEGQKGSFTGVQKVWSIADLPTYLGISPNSLAVGKDGNRFTAETGIAMLDPWIAGPNYYSIWSTTQLDELVENGFKYNLDGVAGGFLGYCGTIPENTPLPEAYDVLQTGIDMGFIYKADTLEQLASQLNMDGETLAATVEAYNGFCEAGEDTECGKDPMYLETIGDGPYYAVKMASYSYGTCGGLDINEKMQVLNKEGAPVEGLFAVGGDSMGVLFSEKKPYVTYGGANNGWALTSGYVAGTTVVDYVNGK